MAETKKLDELIGRIEKLSVVDLAELVKTLEEKFGVSGAMLAPASAKATAGEPTAAAEAEEKSAYTIHLTTAGEQKIAVIKALREIRPDLGLKEAKDLVDAAPKVIKENAPKAEAEEAKKKLEAAGATIELK